MSLTSNGPPRRSSIAAPGALAFVLLAAACAQPPVRDDLTIEFSRESDRITVTADTWFDLLPRDPATATRVGAAREAVLSGTDPWSARFARVQAVTDRVTLQRNRGTLERATRSAVIPPEDLQALLADTSITVSVLRGDGWRELALYPGASSRASREQQRRIDDELGAWSAAVARYLAAIHRLYSYMDQRPGRTQALFAALLNEKNVNGLDYALSEAEQALFEAVAVEMESIADRMDVREGRAATLHEELDLVFNPFPARISIVVPGQILTQEGFDPGEDRNVVVNRIDLFQVIADLEGRWVSPDPLAALLQEQSPSSAEMAATARTSVPVVAARDVADALRARLSRRGPYTLRWRE